MENIFDPTFGLDRKDVDAAIEACAEDTIAVIERKSPELVGRITDNIGKLIVSGCLIPNKKDFYDFHKSLANSYLSKIRITEKYDKEISTVLRLKYAFHTSMAMLTKNLEIYPEIVYPAIAFLPFGEKEPVTLPYQIPSLSDVISPNDNGDILAIIKNALKRDADQAQVDDYERVIEYIMNLIPRQTSKSLWVKVHEDEKATEIVFQDLGDWTVDYDRGPIHVSKLIDMVLSGEEI